METVRTIKCITGHSVVICKVKKDGNKIDVPKRKFNVIFEDNNMDSLRYDQIVANPKNRSIVDAYIKIKNLGRLKPRVVGVGKTKHIENILPPINNVNVIVPVEIGLPSFETKKKQEVEETKYTDVSPTAAAEKFISTTPLSIPLSPLQKSINTEDNAKNIDKKEISKDVAIPNPSETKDVSIPNPSETKDVSKSQKTKDVEKEKEGEEKGMPPSMSQMQPSMSQMQTSEAQKSKAYDSETGGESSETILPTAKVVMGKKEEVNSQSDDGIEEEEVNSQSDDGIEEESLPSLKLRDVISVLYANNNINDNKGFTKIKHFTLSANNTYKSQHRDYLAAWIEDRELGSGESYRLTFHTDEDRRWIIRVYVCDRTKQEKSAYEYMKPAIFYIREDKDLNEKGEMVYHIYDSATQVNKHYKKVFNVADLKVDYKKWKPLIKDGKNFYEVIQMGKNSGLTKDNLSNGADKKKSKSKSKKTIDLISESESDDDFQKNVEIPKIAKAPVKVLPSPAEETPKIAKTPIKVTPSPAVETPKIAKPPIKVTPSSAKDIAKLPIKDLPSSKEQSKKKSPPSKEDKPSNTSEGDDKMDIEKTTMSNNKKSKFFEEKEKSGEDVVMEILKDPGKKEPVINKIKAGLKEAVAKSSEAKKDKSLETFLISSQIDDDSLLEQGDKYYIDRISIHKRKNVELQSELETLKKAKTVLDGDYKKISQENAHLVRKNDDIKINYERILSKAKEEDKLASETFKRQLKVAEDALSSTNKENDNIIKERDYLQSEITSLNKLIIEKQLDFDKYKENEDIPDDIKDSIRVLEENVARLTDILNLKEKELKEKGSKLESTNDQLIKLIQVNGQIDLQYQATKSDLENMTKDLMNSLNRADVLQNAYNETLLQKQSLIHNSNQLKKLLSTYHTIASEMSKMNDTHNEVMKSWIDNEKELLMTSEEETHLNFITQSNINQNSPEMLNVPPNLEQLSMLMQQINN